MNTFTYNSIPSSTYKIFIEHRPVQTFPQRMIESISIPGRSGNLLYDTGAYSNVTVTYQAAYRDDGNVRPNAIDIATWLYQTDYCELTDTYNPLYYRKAIYVSPMSVADVLNVAGRVNFTFDCKPQRYLISGKTALSPAKGSSISNAYEDALPVISLTGNGTLTVGSSSVVISGNTGTLTIDSERQTAEVGGNNANNLITLTGGFPVLKHGNTTITWNGTIGSVSVTPNWWTL